jgi:ABC-type uncharacterized transport system permease subunit
VCVSLRDWIEDGRYPLFGLRETLSFLAWTLVVAYGLAYFRYQLKALGTFLMPLVAFLVTAAMLMRGSADARIGTVAAGASGRIFPHPYGLSHLRLRPPFFIVFAASAMYLWQERELKLNTFSAIFHRLPSLTTVDDIALDRRRHRLRASVARHYHRRDSLFAADRANLAQRPEGGLCAPDPGCST